MIEFFALEKIGPKQVEISNWILLKGTQKAVKKATSSDKKNKRAEQFEGLKKAVFPNFDGKDSIEKKVAIWWQEEAQWCNTLKEQMPQEEAIDALLYRLLAMFLRNDQLCPFRTEKNKMDDGDFDDEQQKLFKSFCIKSIRFIKSQNYQDSPIKGLPDFLKKYKGEINLAREHYSAMHELQGKDWDILKGVAIGGTCGVVTSIFLGPIVGGWIGEAAGLYGAAATSYGMAVLGGGSLAAGGFGMAGGSAVLGLACGIGNGINKATKNASIDELNLMQAETLLPSVITAGGILYRYRKNNWLSTKIHITMKEKLRKFIDDKEEFEADMEEENEAHKKKWEMQNKLVDIYERASRMSEEYVWINISDMWSSIKSGIKSWAA